MWRFPIDVEPSKLMHLACYDPGLDVLGDPRRLTKLHVERRAQTLASEHASQPATARVDPPISLPRNGSSGWVSSSAYTIYATRSERICRRKRGFPGSGKHEFRYVLW